MKTRAFLAALLALALLGTSATAQPAIKPSALVGKWVASAQHPSGALLSTEIKLAADSTFTTTSTANDKVLLVASGTWTLTGTKLEWRYERSSQPAIAPGFVDVDDVQSVSDAELVLVSKLSGKTNSFRKAR